MHPALKAYFQEKTNISEERLAFISSFFKEKKCRKNEYLLRQGEVCRFNYFVVAGCMRIFSTGEGGMENTRYFAFEGKFGTSFMSLISREPSIESIQCLEKTTVYCISREDFYFLVESEPAVNKIYRNILESAYITTQKRIYNLQSADSLDRLRWLLKEYPTILNRISSKIVASYLSVTPYTLSRLKAKL
jgi:CRP-like cAMP-binding protein